MRDEKDPGTIEMSLHRKPGRPAKGNQAMSAAERMRAYRQRTRGKLRALPLRQDYDGTPDVVLLAKLRRDLRNGNAAGIALVCEELMRRHPFK